MFRTSKENYLRTTRSLAALAAIAATATAVSVAPAMADPVNTKYHAVTPHPWDVVGTGAGTQQYLVDALSVAYNASQQAHHKADTPSNPYLYSWDATPPTNPLDETQSIATKPGCKAELRPNGASPGIKSLAKAGTVKYKYKGKTYTANCVDFARSSRSYSSTTDPVNGPGGVQFVVFARDAVSYATTSNSNVPANLTTKQLAEIFNCAVPKGNGFLPNTWGALLGSKAKSPTSLIDPILPQPGAGTLTFWLKTLKVKVTTASGEPACSSAVNLKATAQPEENEGIWNGFRNGSKATGAPNPNVLFPYSVGSWIEQAYHAPAPGKAPKPGQNKFGKDENGVLTVRSINGTAPTQKVGKGKTAHVVINPSFSSAFKRTLFDAVRWAKGQSQDIPAYEQRFFGKKGFFCSAAAFSIIEDYGFEPTVLCGSGE
jgi:ABC-type phosphate transport system substrate-binding protein